VAFWGWGWGWGYTPIWMPVEEMIYTLMQLLMVPITIAMMVPILAFMIRISFSMPEMLSAYLGVGGSSGGGVSGTGTAYPS